MFSIIFIIVGVIFLICFYIEMRKNIKGENIFIEVTIPFEHVKKKEVVDIKDGYKKECNKLLLIMGILYLPIIFISYMSWILVYIISWIAFIMYIQYRIFKKYNEKLMKLKKENNWFLPSKHIITIDTELSRMRDEMSISKKWFLPSIICSIIPIVLESLKDNNQGNFLLVLAFSSIIGIGVFYYIFRIYEKGKNIVFTDNSKVNIACNMINKKMWTMWAVIGAFMQSISILAISISVYFSGSIREIIIVVAIIPIFIILFGSYFTSTTIKKKQKEILDTQENVVYVDEDQYWKGLYYYNINDSRVMVEERNGMGTSINLGTKGGKIIAFISAIFTSIIILFLTIQAFIFDYSKVSMTINDNIVEISAPQYGTQFTIDEIEDIKIINEMPKGFRTNGVGAKNYLLGEVKLDGYGRALAYVKYDPKEYVVIKLKDKHVFINGENIEETKDYYDKLFKLWKEK